MAARVKLYWLATFIPSTDKDCREREPVLADVGIAYNNSVQLRMVQPEHGGGSCNCWGVKKLVLTGSSNGNIIELNNKRYT